VGQLTGDYSCFLQEVLYCAKKAGVTHILKAGGAQVEGYLRLSYAPICSLVLLMLFIFRQSQLWHGELDHAQRYLRSINLPNTCLKSAVTLSVYVLVSNHVIVCLSHNCK
jgi:hypothetical protein